jgi:D-glycero-alpha-D-manno-heptose-7-phosphate kinase
MIISRAPLRLPLAGGGTDLPSFYNKFGGNWISVTINKYCYSQATRNFQNVFFLKYSSNETVNNIADIKHNLIREALRLESCPYPLELTFSADLPGGTGLGSSASFLVSLLDCLSSYKKANISAVELAEKATKIEMEILGEPIGLQDQYASAIGGLNEFTVTSLGKITWSPLNISQDNLNNIQDSLMLYFTGFQRESKSILSDQVLKTEAEDINLINNLNEIKAMTPEVKRALINGDVMKLGQLFNSHWKIKKNRNSNMSNNEIDNMYETALKCGALGGKLVGAGGGGFLLFVVENKVNFRKKMLTTGLREIPFNFEFDGVTRSFQN